MFKQLTTIACLLAAPAMAQANFETVVEFSGPLGQLQLTAGYVRADAVTTADGTARLAIAMNREAQFQFANFTQTHRNASVAFSICGTAMERVEIASRDTTGFIQTEAIPADVAEVFAAVINDERACPTTPIG